MKIILAHWLFVFALATGVFTAPKVAAQNPYYDAIKLAAATNADHEVKNSDDEALNILYSYMPQAEQKKVDAFDAKSRRKAIADFYNTTAVSNFIQVTGGLEDASPLTPSLLSKGISSIGGLNVTNIADGLAKFLIKRFKAELTLTFFKKFKDDLNSSAELKTLFPETYKTLLAIDKDIDKFSLYLNTLRQVFIKDLTNLYGNFKKAEQLKSFTDYFNARPGTKTLIVNALYFIDQFSNGNHPGETIEKYDINNLTFANSTLQQNFRSSVLTVQLFSNSIKSKSGIYYWVPVDSIKSLFITPVARDIYFGLIYLRSEGIKFAVKPGEISLQEILVSAKKIEKEFEEIQLYVERLADQASTVNDYIANIKGKKKNEIDFNDYYNVFTSSLDLLDNGTAFIDLIAYKFDPQEQINLHQNVGRWINLARTAGDLYVDIKANNYSSAIINVIELIDSIASPVHQIPVDANATLVAPAFYTKFLKYGAFMAAIAQAQNSDDVEKAIESIALPVGSFSVKQHSDFNISLNGYVGYAFDFNKETSSGIYAPLGLSFSWGLGAKKNAGAISIFTSLLDVGGIVSYRLKDDTTSKLKQDVRLESILSPSAQLLYEIPNWPVAICAGWRLTPKLVYSSSTDFLVIKPKSVFNLSVLIDIPLITLWNKTK